MCAISRTQFKVWPLQSGLLPHLLQIQLFSPSADCPFNSWSSTSCLDTVFAALQYFFAYFLFPHTVCVTPEDCGYIFIFLAPGSMLCSHKASEISLTELVSIECSTNIVLWQQRTKKEKKKQWFGRCLWFLCWLWGKCETRFKKNDKISMKFPHKPIKKVIHTLHHQEDAQIFMRSCMLSDSCTWATIKRWDGLLDCKSFYIFFSLLSSQIAYCFLLFLENYFIICYISD